MNIQKTIYTLFFAVGISYGAIANATPKVDTLRTPDGLLASELLSNNSSALQEYANLGYRQAIDEFMNEGTSLSPSTMGRIAESFRKNGNYPAAEGWFEQMISQTENALHFLHYAEVLKANGKCQEAKTWFAKYEKSTGASIDNYTDCVPNASAQNGDIKVTNAAALNTPYLDFSPVEYQGGLLLTSNRHVRNKAVNRKDKWSKNNFTDIIVANKDVDYFTYTFKSLKQKINSKFHDGVPSFMPDGNTVVFTKSNKKGKNKNNIIDLKLYSIDLSAGINTRPTELPINSDDYATCHPSVSLNGNKLYFASNRPGGFGGLDIWVSEMKDGAWQSPKNLGPTVNTKGNESFPYVAADDKLYYSSNGLLGFGGLDIFMTSFDKVDNAWTEPINLGEPMNSTYDDFGLIINNEKNGGYLSSNRIGGLGEDDIYTWEGELSFDIENNMIDLLIVDQLTQKILPNVEVVLVSENGTKKYTTDSKGQVTIRRPKGSKVKVKINENGYTTLDQDVNTNALNPDQPFKLKLKKVYNTNLEMTILNLSNNRPLNGAKVVLENLCTGEKTTLNANSGGKVTMNIDCACNYKMTASKTDFVNGTSDVIMESLNCQSMADSGKPVKKTLGLSPKKVAPAPPVVSKRIETSASGRSTMTGTLTANKLNRYFLGVDEPLYGVGQVIQLSNILYDFNKANIRSDASYELDYLYTLMTTYPSLNIEMMSHTDARGKQSYNQDLSQRRAVSARQYLISKGIAPSRITARGYGESSTINGCVDGVNCSEDEHQRNRRTEIKVTAFSESNVRIQGQ